MLEVHLHSESCLPQMIDRPYPPSHKYCITTKCSFLNYPASAKAIKDPLPPDVV